jgi:HD-GYP domain-containing protein (c-di-GMP phosphodiesterase class II)
MRYLPTSKLTPGMALGQDIYDGGGRLLLAKHLILSEEYISNLEFLGFPGAYIDDEFTKGIEIQQVLSPEIRSQALKLIHDLFRFDSDERDLPVKEIQIRKMVEDVVCDILNNGDVMCNMLDIRNYDDYIYFHSIAVGVLSALIGAWHGIDGEQIKNLAIAGMLHDFGKTFLPAELVERKWMLRGEDREQWKQHPKLGADYLRSTYNFPTEVYEGVLGHHEWYNGQGYPEGKKEQAISLFARIIKLADSYDTLTSNRPSCMAMAPSEVLEYTMAMSGTEFDPNLVKILARKIALYPIGYEVELSDGRNAVVVKNYKDFTLRPVVKILGTGELVNLRDDVAARNVTVGKLVM